MVSGKRELDIEAKFIRFHLTAKFTSTELASVFTQVASLCVQQAKLGAICVVAESLAQHAAALYAAMRDFAAQSKRNALRLALVGTTRAATNECEYMVLLAEQLGIDARSFSDDGEAGRWVVQVTQPYASAVKK
jgi:hypothetical protein